MSAWQTRQGFMKSKNHPKPALKMNDLITAYNKSPAVTWDEQKPLIVAAAAAGLLTSIEGPNEMNNHFVGNGTHGVGDLTDRTDMWAGPQGNVALWAEAIHSWKGGLSGSDAAAMASVEVLAPTITSGLPADYASLRISARWSTREISISTPGMVFSPMSGSASTTRT